MSFPSLRAHFIFNTEYYSIFYMYHNVFIHSPTEGHLGCFQKQSCCKCKHFCACFHMDINFQFDTEEHNWWIIRVYLVFCKKLPNCLPKWTYNFVFPLAMHSTFFASLYSLPPIYQANNICLDFYHGSTSLIGNTFVLIRINLTTGVSNTTKSQ